MLLVNLVCYYVLISSKQNVMYGMSLFVQVFGHKPKCWTNCNVFQGVAYLRDPPLPSATTDHQPESPAAELY